MRAATLAWESAADVNFIEVGGGEPCSHDGALFTVGYEGDSCLWGVLCTIKGLAFPPNAAESDRTVYLWDNAFLQGPAGLERTITHELGHVLGLSHEHARFLQPEGTLCDLSSIDDGDGRGVTAADSDSVMGYPQCFGTNPNPLPPYPSTLDRTTVSYIYNLPRSIIGGASGPPDSGTLVWHRPAGQYIVWESVGGVNQPIQFVETTGCYDENDCSAGAAPYWKPVLLHHEGPVDVLMYGPGDFDEMLFKNLDGSVVSDVPGNLVTNVDVPIVLDRFFGPADRSVWWHRPEDPADRLWRDVGGEIESSLDYDDRIYTDGHYSPIMGKLVSGQSSMLWVSPTQDIVHLTRFSGGGIQETLIDKTLCGLSSQQYNGVSGDFDGDQQDEIAWYDFEMETVTYWASLPNCMFSPSFQVGKGKLAAIRLNGAKDSLMVYRPQDSEVQFYDVSSQTMTPAQAIFDDASPILRDFDRNGCTDILWFTPHTDASLIWQSQCDGTFRVDSVVPPSGAYPLGYGPGHGRL
ncbi:hypothetical protein ENSA5_25720 [Enhygromyxa salina]|uniref:Peptidase metallopeptidase domain-containing protein n=2 Tax=Enhygromyxa salina TaxID=215803 RepID=A0A2S9YAI8_9BACT|nr:hypothetical protein ENSA5_25720 [Enhygromyxa salina]